jgi:cell division protein FtsB
MTARRGSIGFKVAKLARSHFRGGIRTAKWYRRLTRVMRAASTVLAASIVLLLTVSFGSQMWRVAALDYQLHQQTVHVEQRNASIERATNDTSRRIVLLHDADYLVPLIHEQLGLVKPHEVFIELRPAAPASNH